MRASVVQTREDRAGLVRLIVESFRDASNPSVDIAVEEILMTFEDQEQDTDRLALLADVVKRQGCVELHRQGEICKAYVAGIGWTIQVSSVDEAIAAAHRLSTPRSGQSPNHLNNEVKP